MKTIVIILCLVFPVIATAQNQGINGGDMQQMMQLMQKMQQCMAEVDQAELEALGKQSDKVAGALEVLCKKGERKKAQKKAIAYSKKLMKNPALVQMKKCGEITKGMVPENLMPSLEDQFDFSNRHVCDN